MDSGTNNSHADVWESGTNDATDGTGKREGQLHTHTHTFTLVTGELFQPHLLFPHGSTVAWRNTLEDWAAEDWTEDVSVS